MKTKKMTEKTCIATAMPETTEEAAVMANIDLFELDDDDEILDFVDMLEIKGLLAEVVEK